MGDLPVGVAGLLKDKVFPESLIKEFLGIPYLHRGRSVSGLDCYGLLILCYKKIDVTLFDIEEEYSVDWAWQGKNYFLENYHKQFDRVPSAQFFDIALFKKGNAIAAHAGLMLDNTRFIHCARRVGVVVGRIGDNPWRTRIDGFYRMKR